MLWKYSTNFKFKFNENHNPIKSASMMEIKDGTYKFNSTVTADEN